jgi:hypothetical protein
LHLVIYHFVIEGAGLVRLDDGSRIDLEAGDVIVLPHGEPHGMCSAEGVREMDASAILEKVQTRDLRAMRAGGGGKITRFVCGYLACDPLLCRPILEGLPAAFKVNLRGDSSGRWLESSILHLVEEAASGRAGSEAMLAKLSEALFVDTLRRYIAGLSEHDVGWLAAARDPVLGRSLTLLHRRPDTRGRSPSWPRRWALRVRLWSNASRAICPSRRSRT